MAFMYNLIIPCNSCQCMASSRPLWMTSTHTIHEGTHTYTHPKLPWQDEAFLPNCQQPSHVVALLDQPQLGNASYTEKKNKPIFYSIHVALVDKLYSLAPYNFSLGNNMTMYTHTYMTLLKLQPFNCSLWIPSASRHSLSSRIHANSAQNPQAVVTHAHT